MRTHFISKYQLDKLRQLLVVRGVFPHLVDDAIAEAVWSRRAVH